MYSLIVYALCAALAPVLSIGLSLFLFNAGFDAYWPVFSDDVTFNHQIRTFAAVGFSGGYYTVGEVPAPASFTHFGPHGPFYPALYGLLLWPFGAPVSGPIWVHHGVIYAATLLGLILARPSKFGALCAAAVISTFWPAISMLTVSMQEGLHFSIAILGAAAAFCERARIGAALYMVASLIRPTWVFGLPMLVSKPKTVTNLVALLGGVALLSAGSLLVFKFISAPVPKGIVERAQDAIDSGSANSQIADLAIYFSQQVFANLTFIVSPSRWQPLEGQVLVLSVVVLLLALRPRADWRLRMSALVLTGIFALVMTLYDAGAYRGFRILAPFTLLALVTVGLSVDGKKVVALLIVINLLFVGSFMQFVQKNRGPIFGSDHSDFLKVADDLSEVMRFDATADPWCNTILVDHADIGAIAATIPPGFGLSVVASPKQLPDNPRSAFVMGNSINKETMKFPYEIVYRHREFSIFRNLSRECRKK